MEFVQARNGFAPVKTQMMPWIVCLSASLFFFFEFIQGNMFASIADNMMQAFNIQIDKMTYLSSVYYCSNVIFLFFAGMILDRRSAKQTMIVAMSICVMSTFILAHTDSYGVALLCRFLTGIGSAFCFLGPIRIASRWFPPQRMAFVTGLIVTFAMMGGMLAQYPLTRLVMLLGWRDAVSWVGWLGVILLVAMVIFMKDKPLGAMISVKPNESLFCTAKRAFLNAETIRAALFTSLMNMAIAVFGALLGSLYLIQRLGVSKDAAAMVNSMLFLGAILGGPFMGWLSDKIRLRVMPMKLGAFAALTVVFCINYMPVSLSVMAVLFFLLGFFTASQVISYAMVAESSPLEITATAVSLISILTQAGYVLYQNFFSWTLLLTAPVDLIENIPVYTPEAYKTATVIIPVGILLALLLAYKLKETHCQQKVI